MALQAKDNYFDTGSSGKPPRFNKDNFSLWKTRMELFLSGSDPQIPYFLENGPHVPTQTVHAIPAAGNQPAVPERELVKRVTDWNDEDRRLVNIDTKARSLIAMSLPDDVFHLSVTFALPKRFGTPSVFNMKKKLKKNLIRDTKDTKSNSVALVSDSVPTVATPSSVTITELESSDSDMSEDPEFNESLALLTKSFKKFAKKGNFHKKKHLAITDKPKSDPVDKATAICYNCQGKGHFANDCGYRKSQFAPSSAKSSSKNPKYQRLKEKYKKMKIQCKGKGLIAEDCDWDDVSSDDSSDEEDTQVALMAIIEEPTLALMAKIEEVPEEIPTQAPEASSSTTPEASTSATDSPSQVPIPLVPLESLTQLDLVTLDLYKALNGKTSAEKMNIDLRDQLRECQEKIKQLTIMEENYKHQVTVNKTLCIEREVALAAKERALAELNAEKGLGYTCGGTKSDCSMLKFGRFVSSIPDPNAPENIPSSSNTHSEGAPESKKKTVNEKSKTVTPSKTKSPKPKNKVLGGGPSVSGSKSFSQNPVPRLKIDLKQKTQEKKPIPPLSNAKGILGAGPAHLKFKDFLDSTKRFQYRKCYHCGLNDHIASKCPDATKAEKSAKVKKNPKTDKSVKGKKVVKTVSSVKTPASRTDKSVKAATDSTSPTDTTGSIDKGIWYLDSGCSRHMTGSKSVLSNYREERGPAVTFGGNGKGQTRGYGTLTNGVTTFKRVAYVEGLMHNLLSISQLCDKNHKVSFSKKKCKVKNRRKEVILIGVRHADIYIINMNTSTDNFCFVSRASSDTNWLWHKRLSHLNFKTLNQLCINNLVIGLPDFRYTKVSLCSACEKGKQTRASFKSKQISSISSPLQLLHMDLFGPVNVQSIAGKKYTLVIVDEYSRYTWVFFLRSKSDAPEEIILFVRKMERLNNLTVQSIRSDHGTEFKNSTLETFFDQKGISQNFSSVRTPQQNGVAERRNRTLIEAARSMLSEANLATQFWAEAETLSTFLLSKGFVRGKIDSTLFLKKYPKHILLVQIYVDDIIFGSTNPKLCEKFELLMKSEYKMSMMGELTFFLGLQIKQSEKGIFINQGKYVHEMLKKFDLTSCTPMKTPMAPPLSLDKDSKGKPVDVTLYRGMIGSLLYLTASRPDIMYSTCLCARYQAEPKESHLTAVKRIFRYLKGTPNLGLWYSKDSGFDLTAYSDSDFAGCKIDRKSTTGGCHLLGGKLVSWTSKKQNSVSTSTAEAEYVAAGICCAQVLWLRNQLQDYDIQLSKIPIYCDNTSAIAIANNPVLHSKTKHIEVRYHFIRDHVMNGDIELHFVPTEYQLADLFTKPLDVTRFNMLISELGMMAATTSTSLDAQLSSEATTLMTATGNLPIVIPQHDLQFKGNNLIGLFDLPEGKEYLKPAKDFLLQCPLKTAFTINPKPHKPFLLQIWSTATTAQERNSKGKMHEVIKFQIQDDIISFGIGTLRNVLNLPKKNRYPPAPSAAEIIELLDAIGYNWPEKEGVPLVKTAATVHKTGLNAKFYYIWNTFGLCLTGKTGSTEQFPTIIQQMVFSALKNRKFDYAHHIWDDMVKKIKNKNRVVNVPFTRFFSAVLEMHMGDAYPKEGTFNNYALGHKFLDQVSPKPDDIPLSDVLVVPETQLEAEEQPTSPSPAQGMFSLFSSKPSSSLSLHAMSVANPILTSPAATTSSAPLKRPPPSGSTPPPQPKRAKSKAQKKKKAPAGKKYYITLPQLFNKPSPLSKTSTPADTPVTAPVQQEPEVVHLEHSENVEGNRSDTLLASGNTFEQIIAVSSSMKAIESSSAHLATLFTGSLGATVEGHPQLHQDDPFNDFIFTDPERQLSAAELRRQSAERQLQEARAALQQQEDAHQARLQALELELASAKAAATAAEAAAATATAAAAAATPPPTAVSLTIPCLDTIHDKVSQVATSSNNLQASVDDLKATVLPALSSTINNSSNSLTTFQSTVVQRLDAQEAGLRALQEQVTGLTSAVNAITSAPPPPPSFTNADRDILQSLISSSFISRKLLSDMASLLQRNISTAALAQAPDEDEDDDEDDDEDEGFIIQKVPASTPTPGPAHSQWENPGAHGTLLLPSSPSSSDNQPISTLLKSKPTPETITLDTSSEDSPTNNLQMVIYQPPKQPTPEPTPQSTPKQTSEPENQDNSECYDVNFGSVTGEIVRLMENSPSEQTRAELSRMTFRVTPLNPESIPSKPTRFNPEASSSRTPEIRAPPETICLSSDDEFISDDFSTPASSPRSPPSNSPRSEGENYPDTSVTIHRDGRLDAVIERLESTRVKIPLRTSWDSEFAYLSQEEYNNAVQAQEEHNKKQKEAFLSAQAARRLASDYVDEDDEISADPVLAQKAALKVFNRNAEEQTEEVNSELDWCRDRLHLRKHGAAISGIHLSRTRGKRAKTWITVKRSGVKDVQHTLDKAEVEEVINGLIARIRRTTEIPDDLLQPSSALPQPPVRRSAGASTRRPTPCMPRMVVKPLDLSMLDLSLPPGRFSELHKAPYEHLVSVLFTAQKDKKNQDNKEIIRTVRVILDHRIAFSDTPVPIQVKTEEVSEDSDS
ncbi:hypothetical protein OSB04_023777 [Centaurea solstitialis]|uniref:Uncharacterized protein n=1 Tax=Centaurea solstitialis TaxID=347529 RepID=A0AA38W9R6_9ASTR|nr:hypothetical protein OSB04_023777 [Centaurea solstitialis]